MNYSSLLVTSWPGQLQQSIEAINAMDKVEVHQVHSEKSRCIAVIAADNVNQETDLFRAISDMPSVIDVSLIVHHFEDSAEIKPLEDLEILTDSGKTPINRKSRRPK